MRRYPVLFRESARDDLRAIFDYVVERSRSRDTAFRYSRRLKQRCTKIGDAPFGGAARHELDPQLRMAVFEGSIVILYAVIEGRVEITNIFSGGRDYEALLRKEH